MKSKIHYFNFFDRFAPLVISGDKNQSIRKVRVRMPEKGLIACLTTGARTRKYKRIGYARIISVASFRICKHGFEVGGKMLADSNKFAKDDGFDDEKEMREFFKELYAPKAEFFITYWGDVYQDIGKVR